MSRSVWLDDERKKPSEFDVWVKTADAAIAELEAGGVTTISLDHDLAWEHYETACEAYRDDGSLDRSRFRERTGYDVVLWMAEHNVWPATIYVHTLNPVGRADMVRTIQRYAPVTTRLEVRPAGMS